MPLYMGTFIGNICKDIVSHVCFLYSRIYFKYMYNYMEIYIVQCMCTYMRTCPYNVQTYMVIFTFSNLADELIQSDLQ